MTKPTIKIALTGHVDHGKSTLIGRMLLETNSLPADKIKDLKRISKEFGKDSELAYLADQLKEEREKNITIETTEIYCKTGTREYCFIDTPGHLEFIKNMMTGASRADLAFLLIDAQEGVQEQTRRHAFLIKLLSIQNVLVVINKMDLIRFDRSRFMQIQDEVVTLLSDLHLVFTWVIPVSAKTSENISRPSQAMPWYEGPPLLKAMDSLSVYSQENTAGPVRFPVQDVYDIANEKVIVGQVVAGRLKSGQRITVLPQGETVTIQEIKSFGKKKHAAHMHENIGMTVSPFPTVKRGNVFCDLGTLPILPKNIHCQIVWLNSDPLKLSETVRLRCVTQVCECQLMHIYKRFDTSTLETLEENASQLNINEAGLAHLRLHEPAVIENYQDIAELGRFVIERNDRIQGIGTVYENQP